jgi:hypothetical protein
LSKHRINTQNIKNTIFAFNKPSFTNPSEYIGIDKPKEIIKKNKPLNKNTKILEFLFNQKNNNDNNNNNKPQNYNTKDIFNPKNMKYNTLSKPISQILALDSQIIIPSLVPSSHPSLNIESSSYQPYIASL